MLGVVRASQASHVWLAWLARLARMPCTFGSHASHVWLADSLARTLATLVFVYCFSPPISLLAEVSDSNLWHKFLLIASPVNGLESAGQNSSYNKQQHFIKNRQLQGVYIPTRKWLKLVEAGRYVYTKLNTSTFGVYS